MIFMKKATSLLLVFLLILMLSACGCRHEWMEANCVAPRVCTLCQKTEGEALGHIWQDATCTKQKTCSVCSLTDGSTLPHTPGEKEITTDYILAVQLETQSCTSCGTELGSIETPLSMVDGDYFCLSPNEFVKRLNHIYTSTGRTNWRASLEEIADDDGDYCMASLYCGDVIYARAVFESLVSNVIEPNKDDHTVSHLLLMILPIDIAAQIYEDSDNDALFDQAAVLYKDENLFLDILNPVFQTLCPKASEADNYEFIKNSHLEAVQQAAQWGDFFYQIVYNDLYIEFADFIAMFAYHNPYYVSICTSESFWTNPE